MLINKHIFTSTGNSSKIILRTWPSHHLFALTRQGIPTNMSDQRKYAVAAETTKVTTALKTSSAAQDVHIFPAKRGKMSHPFPAALMMDVLL